MGDMEGCKHGAPGAPGRDAGMEGAGRGVRESQVCVLRVKREEGLASDMRGNVPGPKWGGG